MAAKKMTTALALTKNQLVQQRANTMMVHQRILNISLSRAEALRNWMDPDTRNLDKECGYIQNPTVQNYMALYQREGIASRVVGVYPDECWSVYPSLYELEEESKVTEFEKAWEELVFQYNPWYYLHRADELSGIGQYGVILLGFDDGQELDQPVLTDKQEKLNKARNLKLTYLRVFDESCVKIKEMEDDKHNPRYGLPRVYTITMGGAPTSVIAETNDSTTIEYIEVDVHWSRIIHLADNCKSSEWLGTPRMEPVLNRLTDLRKILGGSAEMFWRGAFPGYAFQNFPNVENPEFDEASIKEQMDQYENHIKRYFALENTEVKQLFPQVADPTQHVLQHILAICLTIGTPIRIFMGSEAGHLASTQDAGTWNRRLSRRQTQYLTPRVVQPFVKRLMLVGALPTVKRFTVDWQDLNAMSDQDRADVALKMSQALLQYVSSGAETTVTQLDFLIHFLHFPRAQAEAMLKSLEGAKAKTTQVWKQEKINAASGPSSPATSKTKRNSRNSLGKGRKK